MPHLLVVPNERATGKYSVASTPADVYERIKLLEDRILAVERVLLVHQLWQWRAQHAPEVQKELDSMEEDPELQYDSVLLLRDALEAARESAPPGAAGAFSPATESAAAVVGDAGGDAAKRIDNLKRMLQERNDQLKRRKLASAGAGAAITAGIDVDSTATVTIPFVPRDPAPG